MRARSERIRDRVDDLPGVGIGKVKLGMTKAQVERALGNDALVSERATYRGKRTAFTPLGEFGHDSPFVCRPGWENTDVPQPR
jgi:hypothetical protein